MRTGFREFLTPPELPAPTESNHAARKTDVDAKLAKDGSQALTGDWDAGAFALRGLLKVVAKTATGNISAAECRGAVVNNAGATDTIALTLPAAVVGASVTIYAKAAEVIGVIPASGERFSSESADVQLDSSGTLGDSLTLVCMEVGVWEVVSTAGTWEVPT
jgi:hypothetical protein